jgi:hypothetical protein
VKCVSAEVIGRGEVHRPFVASVDPVVVYRLGEPGSHVPILTSVGNRARRGTGKTVDPIEQARTSEVNAGGGSAPAHGSAEFAPEPADRRRWWRVNCRDVVHEHSVLTVLVNRDRVALVGPPGESAVLSADGVGQLSTALRYAAEQARK